MIVGMRTGELASQAGVNIQTIRFYERERMLGAPPRTPAGYRCYSRHDLERVVFIKTCQQLGFTLEDIRSLTGLHDRLTPGGGDCAEQGKRFRNQGELFRGGSQLFRLGDPAKQSTGMPSPGAG